MRTYGKQTKGLEDPRDIPGVGAVKAQRRQTQAADNKDCVGHIVAKDPWQEQRKAGEQRLREEQCHQCAEGRYKEGRTMSYENWKDKIGTFEVMDVRGKKLDFFPASVSYTHLTLPTKA